MTRRNATASSCTNGDVLSYDVENRLTSTTVGNITTNFSYNGDGARVKKTANDVTTYYIGNLYEHTIWTGGSSVSKYYYPSFLRTGFGSQRSDQVKHDPRSKFGTGVIYFSIRIRSHQNLWRRRLCRENFLSPPRATWLDAHRAGHEF